jgi:ferrous iron transport protein A
MSEQKTLADLGIGDLATIQQLNGPRQFVRRLLALGVTPGNSVRIIRVAPLGDPMHIQLGPLHLSIRRQEARQVAIS